MHIFQIFLKTLKFTSSLRNRISKALILIVLLNLIFGSLFYFAEQVKQPELTYGDSLWWSIVTMTTVGYGDFFAQTTIGRIISLGNMFIGIGTLGYLLGELANLVIETQSKRKRGMSIITSSDHIIFCNFPGVEKIQTLLEELKGKACYSSSMFVLISDELDEIPDVLSDENVTFIKGNPSDKETLLRANLSESAGVLILNRADLKNSDDSTFVIASVIDSINNELEQPVKVIAEVNDSNKSDLIATAGAAGTVSKYGVSDRLLVQEFLNPGVHDVFQQVISNLTGSQFYLKKTRLIGKTIADIQIGVINHPANVLVVGLIRNGQKMLNPPKTETINNGDQLVILADREEDFDSIENDLLKA